MIVHVFRRASRGSVAVEFSLVAPLLLLLLFGMMSFGVVLATASGLQQLAAEAARASVAGLSDAERTQIAQAFVTAHGGSYPFLDIQQISVATATSASPSASFQVSLNYDLSRGLVGQLSAMMPGLPTHLQRSSVVLTSAGL